MLRGRANLVSVFLCLVCVFTQKPHQAASLCSQDMIPRINELIKKAPNLKWLDSRLYTPNITDYQQKCPSSALKCFAAEIRVLIKEWEEVGESVNRYRRLVMMIRNLATSINQTESGCSQCEVFKEENAEKFLGSLLSALEHVNSRFCTQMIPQRTS